MTALRQAREEGKKLQLLLKQLDDLLSPSIGDGDECEREWDFDAIGESHKPRTNPLKDRMFEKTAELWERLGGSVSKSKEYERFFTALLRPVFQSGFERDHDLGSWPEATFPDRNEMFNRHASYWMRKRGTLGARGPKRKKG